MTAAWPSEQKVRLAPAWAKIDRDVQRLNQLKDFTSGVEGIRTLLRAATHNPVTALRVAGIMVAAHRANASPTPVQPDGDAATTDGISTGGSATASAAEPEDIMSELDGYLINFQKVSIAERALASNLLGGESQDEDHFVRLILRPSGLWVNVDGNDHELTVEPRVLLHQDGAIQITVGLHLPSGLEASQLIKAGYPSSNIISVSELPETYAAENDRWVSGTWLEDNDGGVRVRRITHDEPAAVYDYLDILLQRILSITSSRAKGEWNCYPIIIAQEGSCCNEWEFNHKQDVVRISTRFDSEKEVNLVLPPPRDFSIRSDESFYVNLASAFILHRTPWKAGIGDLNVTLLLEYAMLVYTRTKQLESLIRQFPSKRRSIDAIYRRTLLLAVETRGSGVRSGSARTIFASLLRDLGVVEMQASVNQGISMLSELSNSRFAARTAKSGSRLAVIGVVVAVLANLPNIPKILDIISDQRRLHPGAPFWDVALALATSPLQLSTLILAAIAAYLMLNMLLIIGRVIQYLLSRRKRGYASTIGGYTLRIGEADDLEGDDSLSGRIP